jgi:AcrR family transcriptional regulator
VSVRAHPARPPLSEGDLREACLRLTARAGIDAIGIPQIAAEASVTSAPVYRRFDSADDLIADLWTSTLRDQWRRAARASITWSASTADTTWLQGEILAPSDVSTMTVEALCVARRLGPAGGSVRTDVEFDLGALIADSQHLPPVLVLASLTPMLGAWLLGPIAPHYLPSIVASYDRFADEYRRTEHWNLESVVLPYVPPPQLHAGSGEAALDDLRWAVILSVSQFGVANTTTNRVARHAGRSLNTAYRRLGSKDELIADSIQMALSSDFGFSGSENASSMPFSRQDRLERALHTLRNHIDDRNHLNRSFMLESLLAARHNDIVRRSVLDWIARVDERFAAGIADRRGSGGARLTDLWRYRIASGLGSLVLSLISSQYANRYDPMPAISAHDAVVTASSTSRSRR